MIPIIVEYSGIFPNFVKKFLLYLSKVLYGYCMDTMSKSQIVVVDGGGSTCRVSLCTADGTVLGHAIGSSANIATDFDGTLVNILETCRQAYAVADRSTDHMVEDVAYMGLAGAGLPGVVERLEKVLNFRRIKIKTDWEITVQGALGDGDGTVALLGTGSFFVARHAGVTRHVGGWGFQLGDDGGGAILGRKLLRKAVLAHDGMIAHSPLTRAVLEQFHGTPKAMLEFVQTATPMEYGKFAPKLINAQAKGDLIAMEIIAEEVAVLTATLDRLDTKTTGRLCMLGGLGPIYQKLLNSKYQSICKPPESDALSGAITLAQRELLGDDG